MQGPADGFATAAAAKPRLHEANQTPQRPARLYIRPSDWRTGRLALCGANRLALRGSDVRAKGGGGGRALIAQRRGAVVVGGLQPTHHGLRPPSRAFANR